MKSSADRIFSGNQGEVPVEILVRYARGLATPDEQRRIELAMADDPFLSDAIEGMMKAENPEKINADLAAIQESIDRKSNRKIRPLQNWRRWAQAAAALLILSAGIWLVNDRFNQSTEKLFTDEFEPYPAPPPESATTPDQEVVDEEIKQTRPSESPAATDEVRDRKPSQTEETEQLSVPQESVTIQDEPASVGEELYEEQVTPSADRTVSEETQVTDNRSFNETAIQTDAASGNRIESKAEQPSVAATKSTESVSMSERQAIEKKEAKGKPGINEPALEEAMQLYEAGKYAAANAQFEKVLAGDPSNEQALFYAGVSYLAAGNADEAIAKLKKLENKKNGAYYEAALWYQALAFIQKGEKKEAADLLEKVSKLNGAYKEKAAELLQQF